MKDQSSVHHPFLSQQSALHPKWHDELGLKRWHVTTRALKPLRLPPFSGSMIRGAMGHALLAAHCRCGATATHHNDCLYARLFETGAGSSFVITPPEYVGEVEAGERFEWQLSLIGVESDFEKPLFEAVKRGFFEGLGPERVSCRVEDVEPVDLSPTTLTSKTRVVLSSPWALKRRGRPVRAASFRVHDLLIALAQRQRQLSECFGLAISPASNNEILAAADQVELDQFRLVDVFGERHSNRQRKRHPLQGIQGQLTLTCVDSDARLLLSQLLNPGQWLHGGGKVGFGMGGLRVEPLTG